jgi:UDP-N-acetylmuramoylalanine--D-glutamate ligase
VQNNIALLGYGKTNKAILKTSKICFDIYDDSFDTTSSDDKGNNFYPSKEYKDIYQKSIITPGVPPHNEMVQKSKNIISDFDYFSEKFPFSIWISGTNGKTTLTQMIHHLLGEKISQMGSNIGNPISLMDENKSIWILECSSFSLYYTNNISPNIYLLLPINDDHLSWHSTFKEYQDAKLKPLSMMSKNDIAIIPKCYKEVSTKANTIYYENDKDLAKQLNIDINQIKIQQPFTISAILALSVQKILFDKTDINQINTFLTDKHKVQHIKDKFDRLWIDDSKATNISASIEAIKSANAISEKIYIILGGDSKGVSLEPLIKFAKDYNIHIHTIGKCSDEIYSLATKYNITCEKNHILENAITIINKNLTKNDIALLSPACASLDQFDSYKQRGEVFQQNINKL